VPANVQGATLLSETLSQYSALMLMKRRYGEAKMKRFLRYELDRYLLGRATEAKKEVPLGRVENQAYIHYQKGSLVMYALQDYIGEDAVNRALRRFRDEVAYKGPPYPNATQLIAHLRRETPPALQPIIDDLFESITLFENRAEKATVKEVSRDTFEVTLKVRAQKLKADALGKAQEVPLDDLIDIGVLGKDDRPLYLAKHRVTTPELELRIKVKEQPLRAGIDPFNKLIDRIPDDNVIDVSR
jgi:ABC-2 type transport system permease protein